MKRLLNFARALATCIKMTFLKIIYKKRLVVSPLVLVSNNTKLVISGKNALIKISKFTDIKGNCYIEADNGMIELFDNVFVNRNAIIVSKDHISIGKNTIIGPNVVIYDHDHDYKTNIKMYKTAPIKIGDNVWIGANCTILKGVSIGANAVIAAGCLLTEDVPDNTLVYQKKILDMWNGDQCIFKNELCI